MLLRFGILIVSMFLSACFANYQESYIDGQVNQSSDGSSSPNTSEANSTKLIHLDPVSNINVNNQGLISIFVRATNASAFELRFEHIEIISSSQIQCHIEIQTIDLMTSRLDLSQCTGNGKFKIKLKNGIAKGHLNEISKDLISTDEFVVDNESPIAYIGFPSSLSVATGGNFVIPLYFSEPVKIDINDSHLIVENSGNASCQLEVEPAGRFSKSLLFKQCSGVGIIKVKLKAGSVIDFSGNSSLASDWSLPIITPFGEGKKIFLSSPKAIATGECSEAMSVSILDNGAQPVTLESSKLISLAGGGSGHFYSDNLCTQVISSLTIPIGQSSGNFYFRDLNSENLTLKATALNLQIGQSQLLVKDLGNLSIGSYHACSIFGGSLYCWGRNSSGQLGTGNDSNTNTPVPVVGLSAGVSAVATGTSHTCAIKNGKVSCWGDNTYGQLGVSQLTQSLLPIELSNLPLNIKSIAVGGYHTCVILSDETVQCWGRNSNGQLGIGSAIDSHTPVSIANLTGVKRLTLGGYHSCAISNTSTYCWGHNNHGQLGDGSQTEQLIPVSVVGLSSAAMKISAGLYHTCAVLSDGKVNCWGYNFYGQLGDNGSSDSLVPIIPSGLSTGATEVSLGYYHTCVLIGDAVMCFGRNTFGQVGVTPLTNQRTAKTVISASSDVTAIVAGGYETCAIKNSSPICWGFNNYGQIGNKALSRGLNWTPTIVPIVTSLNSAVATGQNHTCALNNGNTPFCWGENSANQLGNSSTLSKWEPSPLDNPVNLISLSAGDNHNCGLDNTGQVYCWGENSHGQLGIGTTSSSIVPVPVSTLSNMNKLDLGDQYSCAISNSNEVYCWGANSYGQIGSGNNNTALLPNKVPGLVNINSISAGYGHVCAVNNLGLLFCWGRNSSGQLGIDSSTSQLNPVIVTGFTSPVANVNAGFLHTCAILTDNTLWCWGRNNFGQLGLNHRYGRKVPNQVQGIEGSIDSVTLGYQHTCALAEGNVWCWGRNNYGQLGTGSLTNSDRPQKIMGLANVSHLSSGYFHTCATIAITGQIYCWGAKISGETGDGIIPQTTTALKVDGFKFSDKVLDLLDENGFWLATFTLNSHTVTIRGPERIISEQSPEDPVLRSVTHNIWVRVLPEPFNGTIDQDWLDKAITANENRELDIIGIALQYIKGAPAIVNSNNLQIAGDSSYGPYLPNGSREEGSDFYDYLGLQWLFPDKLRKPDPDQFRSLDCSGFTRMIWGYRSGLPLEYTQDLEIPGLPRRAFEILAYGPGNIVIPNSGDTPTDFSPLKPGDLLFWDADSNDGPQIDHVGMYFGVDSQGKLRFISSRKSIDGPTMGNYKGESIVNGTGLYTRTFRAARRL